MKLQTGALVLILASLAGVDTSDRARAGETHQADPVHSSVIFRVKHANTAYFWGRFNDITGAFALDSADPSRSSLSSRSRPPAWTQATPSATNTSRVPTFERRAVPHDHLRE